MMLNSVKREKDDENGEGPNGSTKYHKRKRERIKKEYEVNNSSGKNDVEEDERKKIKKGLPLTLKKVRIITRTIHQTPLSLRIQKAARKC